MPPTKEAQITFAGGVNPWQPAHMLKDDEVQTATNVDFSLMNGAVISRRGSFLNNSVGAATINALYHNYNNAQTINAGPFYALDVTGAVYRISSQSAGASATNIVTIGTSQEAFPPAVAAYKQYTIFASGTGLFKDDGTSVTEWIKQVPQAPTVTVNTLAPVLLTGTWTVPDGTLIGTASITTATFATQGNNTCNIIYNLGSTNLATNSGSLGNWATHFINIAFSNPDTVTQVSWDYSVGDNTFSNYLHTEIDPQDGGVAITSNNALALINAQFGVGQGTNTSITAAERANIWSQLAQYNFNPLSIVPTVAQSLTPWAVTVPQFNPVGPAIAVGTDPWTTIFALRISVVTTGTCTCTVSEPSIYGSDKFPLTDLNSGYYYWQTYATTNTAGFVIDESAASPPAGPFLMQNANTKVVQVGSATGTQHGINAIVTYRQGGFMQEALAVSTVAYGTALATLTDTLDDISALTNDFPMGIGVMAKSQFPGFVSSISAPVQDRLFFADSNLIRWTEPGQVGKILLDNFQEVGAAGDVIQGIVAWNPGMVIVNRSSVYTMYGNDFDSGNYVLNKTGSRRGSIAVKTVIRTPYGIPLLNLDGLTLFNYGYDNEIEIPWFTEKYADAFRGSQPFDPAALKGNRVPAINLAQMHKSCATYKDNKIYLAVPTGTSTAPNTVFVLDFQLKQAWWYTYPWNITALYTDDRIGYIYAATDSGVIMALEVSTEDQDTSGGAVPIVYNARTKSWTADTTTVLENLSVDAQGGKIIAKAYYDDSTNPILSTLTNTVRAWTIPPLNGTFVNSVAFDFLGTSTVINSTTGQLNAVYGMKFDLLSEPYKVHYYRTDYDEHNWVADKLWDVAYYDMEIVGTGSVQVVTFVDTTAVMTNTYIGPTNGRTVSEVAFPPETYGRVAYSTYTTVLATTSGTTTSIVEDVNTFLKPWETHYDARNEPAKVTYWRTDIESLEENICQGWDVDLNPNGTVFGTCYIDNVAIMTATYTGSNRQSYTNSIPQATYPYNTFGRTLFVSYSSTQPFKHYKTWWHLKVEPDRWYTYISTKTTGDEQEVKVFKPEISCLGNIVTATTIIDGIPTSTYTLTGSHRRQYTLSMPYETYGRTLNAAYQVLSTSSARFKHYSTEFEGPKEPPRVTAYRIGPFDYPSNHFLKTWQAELDPLNGTVTGTLLVEDQVIQTSTFTGNRRQWFTVGIDLEPQSNYALFTGSRWEARYTCDTSGTSSNQQFKHYESKMDSDEEPFRKIYYSFHYRKIGGATQVDLCRYWSMFSDIEDTANNTPVLATCWWDIDGKNFNVTTLTLSSGHQFTDRIAFPPGGRGRLFEFRCYVPASVKIHNVNVDLMEEGIKSLTRRGHPGEPEGSNR